MKGFSNKIFLCASVSLRLRGKSDAEGGALVAHKDCQTDE